MTEQMSVPTLRFGEYAGDWHTATVGQLVKDGVLVKPLDGNHGNIHPKASDYVESGIPFLMASDIQHGQADLQGCKFIDKDLADSLQKGFACEGDVLLTHKGTVGETTILEGIKTPYVMLTPQVTYYRVKNSEKLDNRFLQKLFMSESFRKELLMKADSGTRPYIGILGQLTLNLTSPEIEEQQKIASFLSKVDEKIALLTKKKDKLTEYKKGVMQQLFNGRWEEQDGQLTFIPPTLRFKADDGSEFPDWEEYKKQIKIVAGNAYKADEYSDSGYLLIQGQNIFPDELKLDETPKHISSKSSNHTTIIKGDIVLGLNRPITNGKLKTCRYPIGDPSVLYQRAGKLEFNADEVDSEFLFQYITSPEFMRQLKLELVGSDQPYIKSNLFGVTKNIFPSIDEQRKISSFLASLNIKLDLVNSELEKAKEWKKGLLQQMFV